MQPRPFIAAELSGNHNGKLERALVLIEKAKVAGASAVKLQTYTADTMTIDSDREDFLIREGLWGGRRLYELYNEAHTPWEWHAELFAKGRELGIPVFSTPFDHTAVDFLESLSAPLYKIASFELVDLPLLEYVAQTKKPIVMSTGMATVPEIEEAVHTVRSHGCTDLTLLHCVSAYPADPKTYNLHTMVDLKHRFDLAQVGLSDHTLGHTTAVAAVALGATFVEKHVTLSRADGGVDAAFSLEPEELRQLCEALKSTWSALGDNMYYRSPAEIQNKSFRRSIYVVRDIEPGTRLSTDNIRIIRPGFGLAPKHYKMMLGRKVKRRLLRGERLMLDDVETD